MSDTTETAGTPTTPAISELLEAAAARAVPVVRAIDDTQLTWSTPCAEYDVRALVDHLMRVVVNFQELAAKREADFSGTGNGLHGDWRGTFADETAKLVSAWAAPGAEDGTAGAMGLPARTVGHMVLGDLTVHAWDVARATGQEYTVPRAVLDEVGPALDAMLPMARSAGVFGEPVAVDDGAPEWDRLLGAIGRDPHWSR